VRLLEAARLGAELAAMLLGTPFFAFIPLVVPSDPIFGA
jgi:hypothetical protein